MSEDITPTESATAPAVNPVRWSGKKTAVAAALALGLSSMGAVAAAAAHERGSSSSVDGRPGSRGSPGETGPAGSHASAGPDAAGAAAEPAAELRGENAVARPAVVAGQRSD